MSLPAFGPLFRRHLWAGIGFLALLTTTRSASVTGWDDSFYVAQLTSAVADRDLLLQNDLVAFPRPVADRVRSVTTILDSGAVHNTFSVGFAVIHGAYAWPFLVLRDWTEGEGLRRLLSVGSLALLVLTTLSTVRLCERWGFAPGVSRLATGLALASGPLALFGTRSYLNSHLASALLASLVLLAALNVFQAGSRQDAFVAGLTSGLLVINRWQDAVLLLALVPVLLASMVPMPGIKRPTPGVLAIAGLAFVSVASLQLLAWRAQFSTWFLVPQGAGYMQWLTPHTIPLLLSPYHGLLPWAPGLALGLALASFPAASSENAVVRSMRLGLFPMLLLFFYLSAAPRDWWGGDSYGPRRLATLVPIAALGLGVLLERLRPAARALASGALLLWAVVTVSAYMSGFDDLWLLAFGGPGPFNPQPASSYAGVHWIDRWGPLHALKPGFTFSDKPHNIDRLVGAIVCAVLVVFLTWLWTRCRHEPRVRRAALALAGVWIVMCNLWLGLVVPSNAEWNRRWLAVVRGMPEPEEGPPFPRGLTEAAHLVGAVRALEAGDEAAFQGHWGALRNGPVGLSEEEVRAQSPRRPSSVPTS